MKPKFGMGAFSMLFAILLISMSFMPAVSAQVNPDLSKPVAFTPPPLKIIENTHTLCVVDVGDIRINLTSNQEHSAATMTIRNTKTNEQQTMDFKTTQKSGSYVTQVTIDGKPGTTFTTNYDPFEPGSAKSLIGTTTQANAASIQPLTAQSFYYWDNVYFTHNGGIKYPHPDYTAYRAYAWQDFYISGNNLYHRHIDSNYSLAIASTPAAVAGGIIATVFSSNPAVGLIVGAVLVLFIGAGTCQILLDEQNCIWEWDAKSWTSLYVPVPPYVFVLPKYERISSITLWNILGISNP